MIDDKQIRAARAVLDWSQDQLALESGVARATIKNIENKFGVPRGDTIRAIQLTLERAGIEFLSSSGVRLRDRMIETYEGADANRILVEDMYETLRDTGGEISIAFLNETRAVQDLGSEYLKEQSERRKAADIKMRLLINSSERLTVNSLEEYRVVPDKYFSDHPMFIYGSKVALLCTSPVPRVVIVKDERFADTASKLFNFIWDRSAMPSFTEHIRAHAS
jgi:transcriptional regulator with XRE-family HTH domain